MYDKSGPNAPMFVQVRRAGVEDNMHTYEHLWNSYRNMLSM